MSTYRIGEQASLEAASSARLSSFRKFRTSRPNHLHCSVLYPDGSSISSSYLTPMKVSWANQFETKLSSLGPLSSKETIQTLAHWVSFNRKRIEDFIPVFQSALCKQPELSLNLIHEILLLDLNTNRWDRLEEVRLALGERVLLQCVPSVISPEKLTAWDESNCFGNPMIMNQLRKKLKEKEEEVPLDCDTGMEIMNTVDEETPTFPNADLVAAPLLENVTPISKATLQNLPSPEIVKQGSSKETKRETVYDFESYGIPVAAVDVSQFQEPCRKIVTLQIARDLRNDSAVQLSSELSAMPEDIRSACATAAEDPQFRIDAETAKDFSSRISNTLLDTNLEEQLQNIKIFRGVVESQRQARSELIRLLVQSRCKFGAGEAAKAFFEADRAKADLLHRKQILLDAMELEGLDVVADGQSEQLSDELAPLEWYNAAEVEPPFKKAKVDQ